MSFDLKISKGDFVIKNGALQIVTDSEKLIQDLLKLCITGAGTNPLHPWYGSFLSRTLVGNAMDTSILVTVSQSQLYSCIENLKSLQDMQVKSFQKVSADEQISAIIDISVNRHPIDPRLYSVQLKVLSKGLKPVTTAFTVSSI